MLSQKDYWINEAWESLKTSQVLIEHGRFLEGAFFCHLSVEKILKAKYTYNTNKIPPKIHDLKRLSELSNIKDKLNEDQIDFLGILNNFQLEGRYPKFRERLLKSTTRKDFKNILKETGEFLQWCLRRMK
ncbi:MAG: HEPN domain-containing protein [Clostridiales bacterium]|nr:HEPN domain-containing protein [Clostridiales bacterium]MCF8023169.1 HEPN domain-containing protein [Clostridiales bacterium]